MQGEIKFIHFDSRKDSLSVTINDRPCIARIHIIITKRRINFVVVGIQARSYTFCTPKSWICGIRSLDRIAVVKGAFILGKRLARKGH